MPTQAAMPTRPVLQYRWKLENDGTGAHAAAEEIQEKTALLPDYGFKNSDSTFGTSFSGIAGSAVVLVVCVGACYAFRFFKKKKS